MAKNTVEIYGVCPFKCFCLMKMNSAEQVNIMLITILITKVNVNICWGQWHLEKHFLKLQHCQWYKNLRYYLIGKHYFEEEKDRKGIFDHNAPLD